MYLLTVTRWLLQFQASHPLPTVSQVEMKVLGREKCMCIVRRQEDFLLTYVSYHGGNSFPEHPADFLFHWPGWGHMSTPRQSLAEGNR